MKMLHLECPGHPDASLECYILDCALTLGQEKNRPAVIVCPGGGYLYCSDREAEPVALRYAASGFHAFVLRYSVGREAAGFLPLKQLSDTIALVRSRAGEWNIDPQKIAVCGFSAGGHLALASGVMGENKPNAMILGYPAVNLPNIPGADFILKLLTGREQVTDADSARLSLADKITRDAPPVFLAATAEDMLTPYGALAVANAYSAQSLGYELHIFQHGPHGYSLADETSADGSSQVLNSAYAHWHGLSVTWLHRIFGAPVHVDKSTAKMAKYLAELGMIPPAAGEKAD